MYFISNYRKKKTEYFHSASKLQKEAAENEQHSQVLYFQAYEIYRKISQNILLENEIKGKAVYYMYLLAKENKVKLSYVTNNGIVYQTAQQRLENLLFCAVDLGCCEAITELVSIDQQSLLYSSIPSYPTTPSSQQSRRRTV